MWYVYVYVVCGMWYVYVYVYGMCMWYVYTQGVWHRPNLELARNAPQTCCCTILALVWKVQ